MKRLTILVPKGENNLSSIVGTYKLFSRAEVYWKSKNKKGVFVIQLAGLSKKVSFYEGLFEVKPNTTIDHITQTNLIIIPSLNHNYDESVKLNNKMIHWIKEKHVRGSEVASICTGAFLLAATGLLEGKECSTHWIAADTFRTQFPEINLQADKIITDNNGIYTNGGAYSFLNLILYLIEKYYDRETADYCTKVFQIESSRSSQNEFSIFQGRKSHSDNEILKAQHFIEKNYIRKISIDEIAAESRLERRTFDRRFMKATSLSALDYMQRVRIEAAKRELEQQKKSINQVMYDCGYIDGKAFRETFKRLVGLSPLQYKNKFQTKTWF